MISYGFCFGANFNFLFSFMGLYVKGQVGPKDNVPLP